MNQESPDVIANSLSVARELVAIAQQHDVDLDSCRTNDVFRQGSRFIWCWRKDSLPSSGPADEPVGTLHYSMQGTISTTPRVLHGSESAFQGHWTEAGTFENLEQALKLIAAWLLDWKEVDDLPNRKTRRYGF